MRCNRCGGGWLVQPSGAHSAQDGWECVGCGQTDVSRNGSTGTTIGDVLAGRSAAAS